MLLGGGRGRGAGKRESEREARQRKQSPWKSEQKEGINRVSTSGLPQQNICATSGKIPWNLRLPSFHFIFFLLLTSSVSFFFLFFFFASSKSLTFLQHACKYSQSNACGALVDFIAAQIGPM